MSILGGLVSGGLGLIGNLFGSDKQEDIAEQNAAMQREFAQHGIRWRVEDAKAAGVHPLYALGSGVTPYSPTIGVGGGGIGEGLSQMGQSLGRAISAQQTVEEKEMAALQRRLVLSQIDEHDARAQLLRSQAGNPQPASVPLPMAGVDFSDVPGASGAQVLPYRPVSMPEAVQLESQDSPYPGQFGVVKPKAVEIESANPNAPWAMAGGNRPGWQRYRLTSRMSALMPPSEEGWPEGIESMPFYMIPMWLMVNEENTPGFWRLAVQEFGGNSRVARWVSRLGLDSDRPVQALGGPQRRR